jgi:hypothetical protein
MGVRGWLGTMILLISASSVARIKGMSHWAWFLLNILPRHNLNVILPLSTLLNFMIDVNNIQTQNREIFNCKMRENRRPDNPALKEQLAIAF